MNLKYQSVVVWNSNEVSLSEVDANGNCISRDDHESYESAEAVCEGIKREGFGGNNKIFPLDAFVEIYIDDKLVARSEHDKILEQSMYGGLYTLETKQGLKEYSQSNREPYVRQTEFKRRVPMENLVKMSRKQKRLNKGGNY